MADTGETTQVSSGTVDLGVEKVILGCFPQYISCCLVWLIIQFTPGVEMVG